MILTKETHPCCSTLRDIFSTSWHALAILWECKLIVLKRNFSRYEEDGSLEKKSRVKLEEKKKASLSI